MMLSFERSVPVPEWGEKNLRGDLSLSIGTKISYRKSQLNSTWHKIKMQLSDGKGFLLVLGKQLHHNIWSATTFSTKSF